jgi:superfamily I DNA/RNA helicase
MPSRVTLTDWRPQGIDELEKAADDAVRYRGNALVVAGPGAGKTELLAQRACFLLQTGVCRRPNRILAISFKRDAAKNLAERVRERCGETLALRFHSYTFDAFAKGLVDRFGQALPEKWRPKPRLRVAFEIDKRFRDYLPLVPAPYPRLSQTELASLPTDSTYREEFIGRRLSDFPSSPVSVRDRAADGVWRYLLHTGSETRLNFPMIGRLAEHLLATNPLILAALRETYGFVFLDEFQDTTSIQYALVKTAFLGSDSELTAVGDDKQSIMRWALALPQIFATFQTDFVAKTFPLVRNHRSAPYLVKIIGALATAIDPTCKPPEPVDDGADGPGECRILLFPDDSKEASVLADLVEEWVKKDGLNPRDICVVTRQKPQVYGALLLDKLLSRDIPARVEEPLQLLLAEPLLDVLLDALRLAANDRAPEAWAAFTAFMIRVAGADDEQHAKAIADEVTRFIPRLREAIAGATLDAPGVEAVLKHIIDFVTIPALVGEYPQYDGPFLNELLANTAKQFAEFLEGRSWSEAIVAFVGEDALPFMTVHKSKGLEYHTVIFLGLEDYPFRGFKSLQDEEAANFFVAFSRAKKRVLFTFSRSRDGKSQTLDTVRPLYDILIKEGVTPEKFTETKGS